ncbi:MAG: hypothetical protein AAFP03_19635, partial [Cyanobacteria bacterium J06598_3]
LPNIFLVSALAFVIAARTRSLAITFAGAIVLVMLYLASLMMVGADTINYQQYSFWAMVDPFGFYAFESKTLTWTVFEHNTLMPQLGGLLLWNRLLWIAIGLAVWTISYRIYKMQSHRDNTFTRKTKNKPEVDPLLGGVPVGRGGFSTFGESNRPTPRGGRHIRAIHRHHSAFSQLLHRTTFELRTILQGRAFWLLT